MSRPHSVAVSRLPIYFLGLALLVVPAIGAGAQEEGKPAPLAERPDYESALQALADHLPEVAASGFEKVLAAGALSDSDQALLEIRLMEAFVRSGQHTKALDLSSKKFGDETVPPAEDLAPELLFWRALALSGSGKLSAADRLLASLTEFPDRAGVLWRESSFTRASILRALGAPGEAIKVLDAYLATTGSGAPTPETRNEALLQLAELHVSLMRFREAEDELLRLESPTLLQGHEATYLRAKVALGEKRWEDAIRGFSPIAAKQSEAMKVPRRMREVSTIGLADAFMGGGKRSEAISMITSFITEEPTSPVLFPLFERLETMGYFSTPELSESLVTWQRSEKTPLAALASYYLGVAQATAVSAEAAIAVFEDFLVNHPGHFLADRALLWISELQSAAGNKTAALAALEKLKEISSNPVVLDYADFLTARADFVTGEAEAAANGFAAIGENTDRESAPVATFNAALAELKAGALGKFESALEHLGVFNQPNLRGELLLERGLYLADTDATTANGLLAEFLRDYPGHSRAAEAHLALASLYLVEFPPKIKSARAQLEEVAALTLTPGESENADYIAVWVEVSGENPDKVIELGQRFLSKWPGSRHAPEILMKIAEVYLQKQDFANAQARFESLAELYPNAPQAEAALFFAGKAAMRINTEASREKAIEIWQKVVKAEGDLSLVARMQQAKVKRVQKKETEALAIIENLLKSNPGGDVLFEAICEKGQVLYVAGEAGADGMREAIQTFEAALAQPSVPLKWRYEVLYRLGKAREKAGDADAALSAYYACLNRPDEDSGPMSPDEYEWYFRCGESALGILAAKDNWQGAIAIYRKMGAIAGPRAQDALDRARALELKHFVWDEPEIPGGGTP